MSTDSDEDFTDSQLALMMERFDASAGELSDLLQMFAKYSEAGGRDVKTFTLILDRIAREGIKLSMCSRVPLDPGAHDRAAAAVEAAADASPIEASDNRSRIHEAVAASALTTAWMSGRHHLIAPDDWPDTLASVVLEAVRNAPRINEEGVDDLDPDEYRPPPRTRR